MDREHKTAQAAENSASPTKTEAQAAFPPEKLKEFLHGYQQQREAEREERILAGQVAKMAGLLALPQGPIMQMEYRAATRAALADTLKDMRAKDPARARDVEILKGREKVLAAVRDDGAVKRAKTTLLAAGEGLRMADETGVPAQREKAEKLFADASENYLDVVALIGAEQKLDKNQQLAAARTLLREDDDRDREAAARRFVATPTLLPVLPPLKGEAKKGTPGGNR